MKYIKLALIVMVVIYLITQFTSGDSAPLISSATQLFGFLFTSLIELF